MPIQIPRVRRKEASIVKGTRHCRIDTSGLGACGIWVRRISRPLSLADEALGLTQVMQTWNLSRWMEIEQHHGYQVEVSGPHLQPTWVWLFELSGTRLMAGYLLPNHPLSGVALGEMLRLLPLVQPDASLILGALIETEHRRRLIWLQGELSRPEG